jgi:predicted translin family RNA/ssDNA-binding protein
MKQTIRLTESELKGLINEAVSSMEYEQLYDKIIDVTNNVHTYCGKMYFENKNPKTSELLQKLSDAATNLHEIAHELEEHLAWD